MFCKAQKTPNFTARNACQYKNFFTIQNFIDILTKGRYNYKMYNNG